MNQKEFIRKIADNIMMECAETFPPSQMRLIRMAAERVLWERVQPVNSKYYLDARVKGMLEKEGRYKDFIINDMEQTRAAGFAKVLCDPEKNFISNQKIEDLKHDDKENSFQTDVRRFTSTVYVLTTGEKSE